MLIKVMSMEIASVLNRKLQVMAAEHAKLKAEVVILSFTW